MDGKWCFERKTVPFLYEQLCVFHFACDVFVRARAYNHVVCGVRGRCKQKKHVYWLGCVRYGTYSAKVKEYGLGLSYYQVSVDDDI